MGGKKISVLPGQVYSMLTTLREVEPYISTNNEKVRMFECQCSCGEIKSIRLSALRSKRTKSCGCLAKKTARETCVKRNTSHGLTKHRLYFTWHNMMDRCYSVKVKNYHLYGRRGISVCERWHDVRNFIEDMYPAWKTGLQLDRTNNNGNYEPENCRWVTPAVNLRNKRTNVMIEFNGKVKCLTDWGKEFGMDKKTVAYRVKNGISLDAPIRKRNRKVKK